MYIVADLARAGLFVRVKVVWALCFAINDYRRNRFGWAVAQIHPGPVLVHTYMYTCTFVSPRNLHVCTCASHNGQETHTEMSNLEHVSAVLSNRGISQVPAVL